MSATVLKANTAGSSVDVDVDRAAQLLIEYGIAAVNAQQIATMLLITDSVEEFVDEMRRRHLSADFEQCLLPAFRSQFDRNVAIRDEVQSELAGLGVPEKCIGDYFTGMGNQPYVTLRRHHGKDQPKGWADEFIAGAQRSMFSHLRGAIISYAFVKPERS